PTVGAVLGRLLARRPVGGVPKGARARGVAHAGSLPVRGGHPARSDWHARVPLRRRVGAIAAGNGACRRALSRVVLVLRRRSGVAGAVRGLVLARDAAVLSRAVHAGASGRSAG